MISRYLVIAMAFGVALYQTSRGAWVEAAGLFALGVGLALLRFGGGRPILKRSAYVCFAITAAAVIAILMHRA